MARGISVALQEFGSSSTEGTRKYLLLITDGWTNQPDDDVCPPYPPPGPPPPQGSCCLPGQGDGPGCYCRCRCGPARVAAEAQAAAAAAALVDVYVIHYAGTLDEVCYNTVYRPNHIAAAVAWLRDSIATSEKHFFENEDPDGNGPIDCAFMQIAELINCDDGIDCTEDACYFGICIHDTSVCP
ncbi:MAG: hypothetical protein GY778_18650 [bacterium]|nr:hypothetical protein [bacterium]